MSLRFAVLGPIEVHDGDRAVDVGPRMPTAVLAILLLEPRRVVPVDRLIDLLWGDEPPATASVALQVYVSGLRRALEPGRSARTPPAVLVTQRPGYVLRVEPSSVDAVRFSELVGRARAVLGAGDSRAALAAARAALELWRGDPYADLATEPFLQLEIARLGELRASAWDVRIEAELALGGADAVVSDIERLLGEDPLRERRWELLALALYRDGRQADALRVLQRARHTLGEELGIEPGPSLRRLEDDIFQHAPTLALPLRPAAAIGDLSGSIAPPTTAADAGSDQPFVGREADLAVLAGALGHAIAGHGTVALIAGGPGIGKTRLAEELARVAAARRTVVAWGRSHEGDAAPAYWPWVQAIRALAMAADPADVRLALAVGAEELAQIVPEIKELVGRELEPLTILDPEAARTRLYDAITEFVRRLAAERPVVLVFDDLQWADAPSLQLLRLLAAGVADVHLLVVCTYRDLAGDVSADVRDVLGVLARVPGLARIRPRPLNELDIERLVAESTGEPAAPGVRSAILARTDGNPFFVTEVVSLLRSQRQLGGLSDEIPSGVSDVIRLRLARLPEETVAALRLAAVVGRDFDLDLLTAAAGLDPDAAIDRVEPAVAIGIVIEHPDVIGRYRFSHSLVWETLYREVGGARRAKLHRLLGTALVRASGGDDRYALEIAHHLVEAVPLGGIEEAFDWTLRAADRADRLLAFEQQEAELHRALDLVARMPAGPAAARRELDVQSRLGSLLLMRRGYSAPEAGEAWSRAAVLCREIGDTHGLATALWGVWSFTCVRGRFAEALAFAQELERLAERTGDPQAAVIAHQTLLLSRWHLGHLAEAEAECRVIADLGRTLPDEVWSGSLLHRDARSAALGVGGIVAALRGEPDEAGSRLEAGFDRAALGPSRFTVATLAVLCGIGSAILGDRARSQAYALTARELAERHGFRQTASLARVLAAWADRDGAGLRAALAGYEETGSRMLLHFFYGLLADLDLGAGDRPAAQASVERAIKESDATGERFWLAELLRLAGVLAEGGGAGEAFAVAVAVAREQGAALLEARALRSVADAGGAF